MFFLALPYVLPCVECQDNALRFYSDNIARFQRAFQNRQSLVAFVVDMHNDVNARLKKPLYTIKGDAIVKL